MKKNLLRVSVCFVLALSIQAQAVPTYPTIPGVYSTGVDNSSNPLPAGTVDPHWTLTASPSGSMSAKVTDPYFMWLGGTSSSAWINDSGSSYDSPVGQYVYTLAFSLSGFNPATATINGGWYSDNTSAIYLNGNYTGITHGSSPWEFTNFELFTLNSGFVSGRNTLSFVVNNLSTDAPNNPTGLQVQILSATAAVPEPSSLAILCLLGSASLIWRNKK